MVVLKCGELQAEGQGDDGLLPLVVQSGITRQDVLGLAG